MIEKILKISSYNEECIDTVCKILRHIEYLGNVGATQKLNIIIDGDSCGRISVCDENNQGLDFCNFDIEKTVTYIIG